MLKKWQELGLARAQIKIRNIKDGVLVLSDRRYRVILKTSAVNFGLKGEAEQDALISAFERVLNGISHPIQILIRTRKMDVERYLQRLKRQEENEPESVYKEQLKLYQEFIRQKVEKSRILSRRFYVVIPFDAQIQQEELVIASKQQTAPATREEYMATREMDDEEIELKLAKQQLEILSSNLIEQLRRLRIRAEMLDTDALFELFYTCFNPGEAIGKTLKRKVKDSEVSIRLKIE